MGKLTPSFIGPTSSQFKGGVSKSQLEWIRILFNKGCSLGKNRKNNPPTEAFSLAALFLFYITRMTKLFIFPFFSWEYFFLFLSMKKKNQCWIWIWDFGISFISLFWVQIQHSNACEGLILCFLETVQWIKKKEEEKTSREEADLWQGHWQSSLVCAPPTRVS